MKPFLHLQDVVNFVFRFNVFHNFCIYPGKLSPPGCCQRGGGMWTCQEVLFRSLSFPSFCTHFSSINRCFSPSFFYWLVPIMPYQKPSHLKGEGAVEFTHDHTVGLTGLTLQGLGALQPAATEPLIPGSPGITTLQYRVIKRVAAIFFPFRNPLLPLLFQRNETWFWLPDYLKVHNWRIVATPAGVHKVVSFGARTPFLWFLRVLLKIVSSQGGGGYIILSVCFLFFWIFHFFVNWKGRTIY